MSVNLLLQAIILGLGELFVLTCANGCRLAVINKDFKILAALVFGVIVGIAMLIVGVHDLFVVSSFGLTGNIIAVYVMFYAAYESYRAIIKANKNHGKTTLSKIIL